MNDDFVAFIHARLDERDQTARAATAGPWTAVCTPCPQSWRIEALSGEVASPGYEGGGVPREEDAVHIATTAGRITAAVSPVIALAAFEPSVRELYKALTARPVPAGRRLPGPGRPQRARPVPRAAKHKTRPVPPILSLTPPPPFRASRKSRSTMH